MLVPTCVRLPTMPGSLLSTHACSIRRSLKLLGILSTIHFLISIYQARYESSLVPSLTCLFEPFRPVLCSCSPRSVDTSSPVITHTVNCSITLGLLLALDDKADDKPEIPLARDDRPILSSPKTLPATFLVLIPSSSCPFSSSSSIFVTEDDSNDSKML